MDFDLTEEQRAFQTTAREFAQKEMMPHARAWDEDEIFPVEALRKAAALGFGGIYVKEDVGGSALTRLDAALIFAPVGALVPAALQAVVKGGIVVCGGIHMSDIPAFPYAFLWGERRVVSVANLTRADGDAFMKIAGDMQLDIEATRYPLVDANRALSDLRSGKVSGAAVLIVR